MVVVVLTILIHKSISSYKYFLSWKFVPRIFNEAFAVMYDGIVVAHLSYQKSGEVPNLKALEDAMNAEYSQTHPYQHYDLKMGH